MQQLPPAPPRRKTSPVKIIGLGCGGLVLLFVALAVLGAVAGSPKTTPSSAAAAPTTPAVLTTSAAPQPKPTKAAAKGPNVGSELRDLDLADGVNVESTPTYEQAFRTLSSKCQEQGIGLGNEVGAILKLLKDKNVNDETRLTVMQHLADSIPGPQKMSCAEMGGAYVTLRTGGQ